MSTTSFCLRVVPVCKCKSDTLRLPLVAPVDVLLLVFGDATGVPAHAPGPATTGTGVVVDVIVQLLQLVQVAVDAHVHGIKVYAPKSCCCCR